ncbi:GNAT family N-acetyltransferase [Paraburkholderia humisilvae]|uniref:GNAT family N-acetyltransferase n=1 Tax=Paraburkholderia humisilvae TaxID=627669 RepID=UPI00362046E5
MSIAELQTIANATQSDGIEVGTEADGLPPPFVAMRSLDHIQAGKPADWCSPFLIIRNSDQAILGACGFKDIPRNGRVEIGYAVSSKYRNQGVATAAIQALLDLAYLNRSVAEVLATIAPTNEPSIRTVQGLRFEKGDMTIDSDGQQIVCWYHRRVHLPENVECTIS